MRDWVFRNWEHVLCGLLLLSRITDIGTTWLATPKLRLEGNPIVRKLGWPFAAATLLACFLPYYSTALAYAALVSFLLVSASNARGIWLARALGEDRYLAFLREAASRSSATSVVAWNLLSPAFHALIGGLVWLLNRGDQDWARWAAIGIWIFAFAQASFGTLFLLRLVRGQRVGAPPADTRPS